MPDYILVLGRDMNADGTDVGPEVTRLLTAALEEQQRTGATLVVAPGYSPDFPEQPGPYSAMMARWLRANGAGQVEVLVSDTFNTFGELEVFVRMFGERGSLGVMGFDWHLRRVKMLCRWLPGERDLVASIDWLPEPDQMSWFDWCIEPLKRLNARLPPQRQQQMVRFYKQYISRRTSY